MNTARKRDEDETCVSPYTMACGGVLSVNDKKKKLD